ALGWPERLGMFCMYCGKTSSAIHCADCFERMRQMPILAAHEFNAKEALISTPSPASETEDKFKVKQHTKILREDYENRVNTRPTNEPPETPLHCDAPMVREEGCWRCTKCGATACEPPETDYLAKIAARTVECPEYKGMICGSCCCCKPPFGQTCVNEGRVLDPRFAELRIGCVCNKGYWNPGASRPKVPCKHCQAKGYTINRDLGVLLECIFPIDGAYNAVLKVMGDKELHRLSLAKGDVFTEALAKAVYEWQEAEKKVTT
ncbi:hypothetical protein LCGC14_2891160, partial [marine sediment metagenome]